MRRFLPWLFLISAVLGLARALTANHESWLWIGDKVARLAIAASYILPHFVHHRY